VGGEIVFRGLARAVFRGFERLGVHVTPRHYAFPIPDTSRLDSRLWSAVPPLPPGIDLRESEQLELLAASARDYAPEWAKLPMDRSTAGGFYLRNRHFETVDAEMFYAFLRRRRPRRLIEAGSGFSSLLAAHVAAINALEGHPCAIEVWDPFADQSVRALEGRGLTLHRVEVQQAPLEALTDLKAGDILFIDSSHVLHVGSDVRYLFAEVIPRLEPGVLVHVHDIFLPAHYPRRWVIEHLRFWNEQYVLQAFLSFNERFRVVWASHFMALAHPDELAAAFPLFRRDDEPASFWFERVS
jgi:predicted O-methyltransferase YrrM